MPQGSDRPPALRRLAAVLLCAGIGCAGIRLALLGGPAAADELLTLAVDQAAIIFVVDGQGRGGEMQVRDSKQPAPVWASVLAAASVRQFTVRPGAYAVVLSPVQKPIGLAAVAGRATIVTLSGAAPDGAYRWQAQSDVAPAELDQTAVPGFISQKHLAPAGYAPTSLDARGAGLIFVFRADL